MVVIDILGGDVMVVKRCPYCNQEMKEGFVENTAAPLAWTPKGKNRPFLKVHRIGDYETGMGKFVFPYGWRVDAFKCERCNVILIEDIKG